MLLHTQILFMVRYEYTTTLLAHYHHQFAILPKIHCSERLQLPSVFLPLYCPIKIPACRTLRHTVPPQSWMSSVRLLQGGWEFGDTNMGRCCWNRSCWCSPAERCCCRRHICKKRENLIIALVLLLNIMGNMRISLYIRGLNQKKWYGATSDIH